MQPVSNRKTVILSTGAEKNIQRIQNIFTITTLNKLGIKGLLLNLIKVIYEYSQLTTYIMIKH